MTPAEHILLMGKCRYCETPIADNDRCGCDPEIIWYLTQAVDILSEALEPFAMLCADDEKLAYIYPAIRASNLKHAHDALEQVEMML